MSDLAALDLGEFETAAARNMQATGKPLDIPLADIAENPDNPRTEFDDKYLAELAADIGSVDEKTGKPKGIKSPVSIQKNPTGKTPWVLNYGACRFRASRIARQATIPAFIDEQFTDYDAVAENQKRRNLTAMEIALFIEKRLGQGDKQKTIAERLHMTPNDVSNHKALLNMPEPVDAAYRDGRVASARIINELAKLHKKHPAELVKWLNEQDAITWAGVQKLNKALKAPQPAPDKPKEKTQPDASKPNTTPENAAESPSVARFAELPELLVTIGKRSAVIDMVRRPTARGMVWVRYQDDGSTAEVKAGACTLIEIAVAADLQTNEVEA